MSSTLLTEPQVSHADRLPELLTPTEVARVLRITTRTVNRYAIDGRLQRVKIGQRLSRYRREDVLALINEDKPSTASARAEVQRILDGAARRILGERVDPRNTSSPSPQPRLGANPGRHPRMPNDTAAPPCCPSTAS